MNVQMRFPDFSFLFFREFTLDMSVEMPNEISNLKCITHQVKYKVFFSVFNKNNHIVA